MMYKYLVKKKKVRIEENADNSHIIDVGGPSSILEIGLINPRKPAKEKKPERPISEVLPEWLNPSILKDLGYVEVKKVKVIVSTDHFGIVELRYDKFEGYIVASTDQAKYINDLKMFFIIGGYSAYRMRIDNRKSVNKLIIQPKISETSDPNDKTEDGNGGDYSGLGHLFV